MSSDNYYYRTAKGIVSIQRSSGDGHWELRVDGILIYGGYSSAEEAADKANKKDFGNETTARLFRSIWVPWDLNSWQTSRPEPVLSTQRN